MSYELAKKVIEDKIHQKEQDFIPAGMAVLDHPDLGQDPEVRRWIACLPYCMGGNKAWSQEVIHMLSFLISPKRIVYYLEWTLQYRRRSWECTLPQAER